MSFNVKIVSFSVVLKSCSVVLVSFRVLLVSFGLATWFLNEMIFNDSQFVLLVSGWFINMFSRVWYVTLLDAMAEPLVYVFWICTQNLPWAVHGWTIHQTFGIFQMRGNQQSEPIQTHSTQLKTSHTLPSYFFTTSGSLGLSSRGPCVPEGPKT